MPPLAMALFSGLILVTVYMYYTHVLKKLPVDTLRVHDILTLFGKTIVFGVGFLLTVYMMGLYFMIAFAFITGSIMYYIVRWLWSLDKRYPMR